MARYRIKFIQPSRQSLRVTYVDAPSLSEAVAAVAETGVDVVRVEHLPLCIMIGTIIIARYLHTRRRQGSPAMISVTDLRQRGQAVLNSVAYHVPKVPTVFFALVMLGGALSAFRSAFLLFETPEAANLVSRSVFPLLLVFIIVNPDLTDSEPSKRSPAPVGSGG